MHCLTAVCLFKIKTVIIIIIIIIPCRNTLTGNHETISNSKIAKSPAVVQPRQRVYSRDCSSVNKMQRCGTVMTSIVPLYSLLLLHNSRLL